MFSNQDNVASIIEAWTLMSQRIAGSDLQLAHGVVSTFANVPLPFLNLSFQQRPAADDADLRAQLAAMHRRADACPHPSMVALCQAWLPEGADAVIADAGFTPAMNLTGMLAESLAPERRPSAPLELRGIVDIAGATDIATINGLAYAMPLEMCECLCNTQLWTSASFGYVGYRDGRAVSAAAAFPLEGAIYLALVATLPEEHGKGFAEAVMRKAIEHAQAATGLSRLILHATDMGQLLYRSMGFAPGGSLPLFSPPARA